MSVAKIYAHLCKDQAHIVTSYSSGPSFSSQNKETLEFPDPPRALHDPTSFLNVEVSLATFEVPKYSKDDF